jgi:hypothetical protein
MPNDRQIDDALKVSEIEALTVAAHRVVEEFKMGRMSLPE